MSSRHALAVATTRLNPGTPRILVAWPLLDRSTKEQTPKTYPGRQTANGCEHAHSVVRGSGHRRSARETAPRVLDDGPDLCCGELTAERGHAALAVRDEGDLVVDVRELRRHLSRELWPDAALT